MGREATPTLAVRRPKSLRKVLAPAKIVVKEPAVRVEGKLKRKDASRCPWTDAVIAAEKKLWSRLIDEGIDSAETKETLAIIYKRRGTDELFLEHFAQLERVARIRGLSKLATQFLKACECKKESRLVEGFE